jgi:hypothetical protein
LNGNPAHAARAKDILLNLAERLTPDNRFLTDNTSLDFSVAILPLVQGFSMMRAAFTDEEAQRVLDRLFVPAAEIIRTNEYHGSDRRHWSNHRTWQNAAVGVIGYAASRRDLVDWAVNDPEGGFKVQIERAFGQDGVHWEGSPRYILYAMSPFFQLAEASAHADDENLWLYEAPNGNRLENLLEGLVQISETNLRLPNVGVRQQESLADFGAYVDLVYKRFPKAEYAWLLRQTLRVPPDRPWTYGLEVLRVFGRTPGPGEPPRLVRMLQRSIGWATMREGRGANMGGLESLYALLKYSRYERITGLLGTAHDPADKGSLEIRSFGRQWAAARSRNNVDDPLYTAFDRQTLSKNTVVVDFKSQPGAKEPYDSEGVSGRLLYFSERPLIKVTQVSVDDAYRLRYRRTVAVIGDPAAGDPQSFPPYVLDRFHLADGQAHTFDYVLRAGEPEFIFGEASAAFSAAEAGAAQAGYQHLRDVESFWTSSGGFVEWRASGVPEADGFRVHLLNDGTPTKFLRAFGPGLTATTRFPLVIARRDQTPTTTFTTLLEPFQRRSKLAAQAWSATADLSMVAVTGPAFRDFYLTLENDSRLASARNPEDANEAVSVQGKYGFVRFSAKGIVIHGDVQSFSLRWPAGTPVPEASHDTQRVRVTLRSGYLIYSRPADGRSRGSRASALLGTSA